MSDTIYRDDAVRAVCKGCLKENPHCRHHWDCPMLTNLGKLPSADRPRGEWIVDEESGTSTCSHCGIVWQFIDGTTGSRFCPDCGADMCKENDR